MTETTAQAAERFRETTQQRMPRKLLDGKNSGFEIAFARCESPIEQAFCLALFQVPHIYAIEGDFRPSLAAHQPKKRGLLVFAQNPIKRYRADFLLVAFSPLKAEPAFLIVECDGREFHSESADIMRDEARERELRGTGFRIIRHRGARIYRSASEVIDLTLACLTTHGWGPAEGAQWISDTTMRRAFADLTAGMSEENPMLGHQPSTFKPASDALMGALIEAERQFHKAAE